jgi:hypothetical protein
MKLYNILIPTLIVACFLAGAAFRPDPLVKFQEGTPEVRLDTTKKALDPATGLAIDEGLDMVRAHCTACHSSKLITQFGGTRDVWIEKIRWMQRTQNLWDLGESEPIILDYLVKNYGPIGAFDRREPLKDIEWYKLGTSAKSKSSSD